MFLANFIPKRKKRVGYYTNCNPGDPWAKVESLFFCNLDEPVENVFNRTNNGFKYRKTFLEWHILFVLPSSLAQFFFAIPSTGCQPSS